MTYEIIKDEKMLRDFIDWLPELGEREKYYFCLFARNKYCKELSHIKSDKAQLKRFVTDKKRMFEKIRQLEIKKGGYLQRDMAVPEEALALYMTVNPRDMWKATVNTMVKLANCIRDENILGNPHQEALSEIQKSKSRTCYIDFDVDAEGVELENSIKAIKVWVNEDAITWLKSRGGLHCLVESGKVEEKYKKTFYKNISALSSVDQTGDMMIPVVGCCQGGFTPHFIIP